MPRVDLTVSQMDFGTGLTLSTTAGDAANDHSFTNTVGDVFLYANNGGSGTLTITLLTPTTLTGQNLTIEDRNITVGAGVTKLIGPFPTNYFNQSDGKVYFDIDVDTSVTFMAIQHGSTS